MNKYLKIALITLLSILLISLTIITILKLFQNNNEDYSLSKYNESATTVLKEMNLYETVNSKEYSKTIETLLENKKLDPNYINDYYKINYVAIKNFSNTVNQLLKKNYNSSEINYILTNNIDDINIILNMDYIDILNYKNITNFKISNLERYINYEKENEEIDINTVITYVNIGLDMDGYSKYDTYTIEEVEENLTILVNKYHKLPDDYIPNDLVSLSYNPNYYLRKEAAEAFEKLTNAALLDNVIIYPFSPYRSYTTQEKLYNNYVKRDGVKKADTYSARPGFSEHQLGLAIDIRSNNLSDNLTSEDYNWMLKNSYKYGFIIRYPKGKSHITQFIEEPWHLRYLGIELATKVVESNLTYDEYYDLYLS